MRELNFEEISAVDGGVSSDAVYGTAVGVATAFAIAAVGAVAVPIAATGIVVLAGASIVASGIAIATVLTE
ncbi:hypothetical protein [Arenimonas metalli]|uniref:Bacteriocin n=1 Tax=Arenimonas metalli CF5-1 TaxID=1384056 RepID=A0A091B0P0_9GAMM|nr:hypothetical protein [Arenimonas metalli]KFN45142.1 hypothetical protein N787_03170 [Arenimonas metalli CF5-1]